MWRFIKKFFKNEIKEVHIKMTSNELKVYLEQYSEGSYSAVALVVYLVSNGMSLEHYRGTTKLVLKKSETNGGGSIGN